MPHGQVVHVLELLHGDRSVTLGVRPTAVDADNPAAAEFKTAMKSAIPALLSFEDDRAEPMNSTASGLAA